MSRKNALIFTLLVIFILLPTRAALANMAPPPSQAWFTLESETKEVSRLGAVQLIGCIDDACEKPVLLQQFGKCEAPGCLPGPVSLSGYSTSFACASNRCLSTAYPNHGGVYFKLLVRFADRILSSNVAAKLPSSYGQETAWKVSLREADLLITPANTLPSIDTTYPRFIHNLGWLGLSILVEVVVAGAGFWAWARSGLRQWLGRLLVVLLVNLATLPVVWLTFPGFGQFQRIGDRLLGVITLVISIFYTVLLVVIYRSPRTVRRWAIPVIALTFLAASAACLLLLSLNHFGGMTVYVQGLPPTAVIVLSEAFAVVAEAGLISLLTRKSIPARWVWITSLLMNAASFALGLFLIY